MLKLIFFGLGIILFLEGAIYSLFPKQMKKAMDLLLQTNEQKIRNISIPICLIGFCLIYFTIRE